MAFGRVAMVGDAAFVARPHVAAGVSKAADDAAALAEAVSTESDVAAALKRFEAARLPDNHRIIERARHLGAYLAGHQDAGRAGARRPALDRRRGDRGNRGAGFLVCVTAIVDALPVKASAYFGFDIPPPIPRYRNSRSLLKGASIV